MTAEDFNRHSKMEGGSNRSLGLVFAGFFLVLAVLPKLSGRDLRVWALLLSALFLAAGLLWPDVLGPLNRAWTKLGSLLEKVVSPILMALLYFMGFTPIAGLLRLAKYDPLHLRCQPKAATYWIARDTSAPTVGTLKDQF